MYRGRLVEEGTKDEIFEYPQHIYTKRLLSSIPQMNPEERIQHTAFRRKVNEEFKNNYDKYFDAEGKIFDLKPISETHSVALP
jgi:peptide/nickel transport system ATP-binding protein